MQSIKSKGKPEQREAGEQEALFQWAEIVSGIYPEMKLMYHTPNGGSRNSIEAAKLKAQGVKSGVPDICLPVARGTYHGLYIELKAGDNKASEKQKEWITALKEQGYFAEVITGWEQARKLITAYLKLPSYGRKANKE